MTQRSALAARWWTIAIAIASVAACASRSGAETTDASQGPDYERTIRPILAAHCFACHGPDAQQRQSGLRLDDGSALGQPAASGSTAIVPGKVEESELIRRVFADDEDAVMPPTEVKKPLSAEQKELLRRWVESGAKYSVHWAYNPPERTDPPRTSQANWANPIDAFILAKLAEADLEPSAEADRATLIRRLSLDLIGLPPAPEEVDAFLADESPEAYERLVDRLLASPRYGEKMAQDWLDLARFGDTNGYQDDATRSMWPYRDYVISAFNRHIPFDQFTLENLAGDLLPGATLEQRVASGFHRNHRYNEEGGSDPEEFLVAYAVDRTNTTATVWLGVTFGCAQCHDHKYDPFTQRDYYRLYAFFNSVEGEIGVSKNPSPPILRLPTSDQTARLDDLGRAIAAREKQINDDEPRLLADLVKWEESCSELGAGELETSVAEIIHTPVADRSGDQIAALRKHFTEKVDPQQKSWHEELDRLRGERRAIDSQVPQTLVMAQMKTARPAFVLERGDFQKPTEQVSAGIPAALGELAQDRPIDRLALARWLVSEKNPLTARVLANRLWKQFFGAGLVRTVDDFGAQGEPPSHPELLDWLATELWETRWDIQHVQKLIVTSSTYRQSSAVSDEALRLDPQNRLLARGPRFRLTAEEIRDCALASSGLLSNKIGGPSVFPYQPDGFFADKTNDWKWEQSTGEDLYRRSLYTFRRRTTPHPALQAFDAPTRENCCPERPRTNTPLQALVTLNDPTFVEAARVLAERVLKADVEGDESRLTLMWRRVLGRVPQEDERSALMQALERYHAHYADRPANAAALIDVGEAPVATEVSATELAAWTAMANVVLNLDEAVTRP